MQDVFVWSKILEYGRYDEIIDVYDNINTIFLHIYKGKQGEHCQEIEDGFNRRPVETLMIETEIVWMNDNFYIRQFGLRKDIAKSQTAIPYIVDQKTI